MKTIKETIKAALKNFIQPAALALALAASTFAAPAQQQLQRVTFTNASTITNLITGTPNAVGGTWARVPQSADGFFLLTPWSAPGALAGTSNLTVNVDFSPDQVLVVSNAIALSVSVTAATTNTTAARMDRTNLTGYAWWRVGKCTTTQLTNVYFRLEFDYPQ